MGGKKQARSSPKSSRQGVESSWMVNSLKKGCTKYMHSFVECLRSVCRDIKPRRIIEWGPGKSTAVLREECGEDAIIISVEHNPKYAKIARETNNADQFSSSMRLL
jgi:predicted O-methyltransferase YrrM